ncbi:hypothetical protein DPMN_127094 [Dreissena polymorpha]|uniref:Uncharacterized protein n=1 Tax=Dreissena polymorpha TaxID=45954 RepID=A0A9D4GYC7_DREPO|nr:hypothetical protein DPMN_127094 [Dreissena polymorpha]
MGTEGSEDQPSDDDHPSVNNSVNHCNIDQPMYNMRTSLYYIANHVIEDQPTSRCIIVLTMSDDDQPDQPRLNNSVNHDQPMYYSPGYLNHVIEDQPDQPFDDRLTSRCITVSTMSDDDQPAYFSVNSVSSGPAYVLYCKPFNQSKPLLTMSDDDQPDQPRLNNSVNHDQPDQPFDDRLTSRCITVSTMSDDDQPAYFSVNSVSSGPAYVELL